VDGREEVDVDVARGGRREEAGCVEREVGRREGPASAFVVVTEVVSRVVEGKDAGRAEVASGGNEEGAATTEGKEGEGFFD
jgi:hypothetical protein